jgi:hypothetical protein
MLRRPVELGGLGGEVAGRSVSVLAFAATEAFAVGLLGDRRGNRARIAGQDRRAWVATQVSASGCPGKSNVRLVSRDRRARHSVQEFTE